MRFILIIMIACLCSSCSLVDTSEEVSKTLWGSSTRVLEEARDNAITKTYDKSYWDCVRNAIKVADKKKWIIFKKDEINL